MIPSGTIAKLSDMQVYLDIYNLTHQELAVLVAGGHGIAKAAAVVENSGFGSGDKHLADINSGKNWIQKTFDDTWVGEMAKNGAPQWISGPLLRITSDFIYFPTVVKATSGGVADDTGKPIEDYMRTFVGQDRSVFDAEFAKVYAKMLEVGTSGDTLTAFDDQDHPGICTDSGPPAPIALPPAVTSAYNGATKSTEPPKTLTYSSEPEKTDSLNPDKPNYVGSTDDKPIYSSATRGSGLVILLFGALML